MCHYFDELRQGTGTSFDTHQMKVEMEVLQVNGDEGGLQIGHEEVGGNHEILMINKELDNCLERLGHKRRNRKCFFYPPIA